MGINKVRSFPTSLNYLTNLTFTQRNTQKKYKYCTFVYECIVLRGSISHFPTRNNIPYAIFYTEFIRKILHWIY